MFRRNDPRQTLSDKLLADQFLALRDIERAWTIRVSFFFFFIFPVSSSV